MKLIDSVEEPQKRLMQYNEIAEEENNDIETTYASPYHQRLSSLQDNAQPPAQPESLQSALSSYDSEKAIESSEIERSKEIIKSLVLMKRIKGNNNVMEVQYSTIDHKKIEKELKNDLILAKMKMKAKRQN